MMPKNRLLSLGFLIPISLNKFGVGTQRLKNLRVTLGVRSDTEVLRRALSLLAKSISTPE